MPAKKFMSKIIIKHKYIILLAIALSTLSGLSSTLMLSHINRLFDAASKEVQIHHLLLGGIFFSALAFSSSAFQYIQAKFGANLVADLRSELSNRLLSASYQQTLNKNHTIFGALIGEIGRLGPLVLTIPIATYNAITILSYSIYLSIISPILFLTQLSLLIFSTYITYATNRRANQKFRLMRQVDDNLFEHFRSISEGKRELLLNKNRKAHFLEKLLHPSIKEAQNLMYSIHLPLGISATWSSMAAYLSILGTALMGRWLLDIPNSVVTQMVFGGLFLNGPVIFLINTATQVSEGLSGLRHLEKIGIDLAPENPSLDEGTSPPSDWQCIKGKDLTFRYPTSESALPQREFGPIDIEIRRGELLFITGSNGSGKSTLLLLLSALLKPSSGTLTIDGRNIGLEIESYRQNFSAIFSDFYLFKHVLDKVGQLVSDEQIAEWLYGLKLTGVSSNNAELSNLNLSTGQRKRLALLHCYGEGRDIWLLDEWAADQDAHFRQMFYYNILPSLKKAGKTLIVVSHDDRYFHVADRVVTLEDGRIAAESFGAAFLDQAAVHLSD